MKHVKTKEVPLFNVTTDEIKKYYQFVYLFIVDRREKGINVKKYRNAYAEPSWAAAEILYLALYGLTKKSKFSKNSQYIRWNNAPKKLQTRVLSQLGKVGQDFFKEQEEKIETIKNETGSDKNSFVDTVSFEFRTDDIEVQRRMQKYIDDFDLHSSIDIDILKNFVKTQIMIEQAQNDALQGKPIRTSVKDLTGQLAQYVNLLGLSKKDRVDLGAERKKGSIAELAGVYESTLQEYEELEEDFLFEELEMLLDKYDRRTNDGDREISAKVFRVVSGGFTVQEAKEIVGRRKPSARKGSTSNS